jgi:ankyrin repeat protein
MKHLLITTIAAVVLVGCGESVPDISIHDAIVLGGDIEAVKQHLAAGTDVDAKDMNGETSLTWAAYSGHKEIAELLLANGARLISFEAYELGSIWGDEPKRSISLAQE